MCICAINEGINIATYFFFFFGHLFFSSLLGIRAVTAPVFLLVINEKEATWEMHSNPPLLSACLVLHPAASQFLSEWHTGSLFRVRWDQTSEPRGLCLPHSHHGHISRSPWLVPRTAEWLCWERLRIPSFKGSGTQLGAVCPSEGHVSTSGDIFGRHRERVLLASSRMLPNILQCTGPPPPTQNYPTRDTKRAEVEKSYFVEVLVDWWWKTQEINGRVLQCGMRAHLGVLEGEPGILKGMPEALASLPIIDGKQQLWLLFLLGGQDDTSTLKFCRLFFLQLFQEVQVTGGSELVADMAPVVLVAQEALPLTGGHPWPWRTLVLDPSGSALVQLFQHHGLPGSGLLLRRRKPGFPLLQVHFWSKWQVQHVQLPTWMKTEGARCLLACTSWLWLLQFCKIGIAFRLHSLGGDLCWGTWRIRDLEADGLLLRPGLPDLARLNDATGVVEMVKAVLAVRDAGQPSLPHHLLRKRQVCTGLVQVFVLEVCTVLWAEVEDWRHTGNRGTFLFVSWFYIGENHAPSQPWEEWLRETVWKNGLSLFRSSHCFPANASFQAVWSRRGPGGMTRHLLRGREELIRALGQ